MGNHTLVEDTEKQMEKFHPWKKPSKDGKQFPQKLPGVLTPKKNDISVTPDSGPCPSPTEHEYKPRYFDKPDWLSSNKENMPLIESITPPSLRNLSLEEENNEIEHEATLWEANVARNLESLPRSSSPYPKKKTSLTDPRMKRGLQDLSKQTQIKNNVPHCKIAPHIYQRAQCQQHHLPSPIEMKFGGFSQTKEEYPVDGQLVSEGSHPG